MQESSRREAEKLVTELRECDGITRPSVAKKIEDLGQAAVQPLLLALGDPNWAVRFWAVRVLESVGDQDALVALRECTKIEQDSTAVQAILRAVISLTRAREHKKREADSKSS